jgi:hypothetical protein
VTETDPKIKAISEKETFSEKETGVKAETEIDKVSET